LCDELLALIVYGDFVKPEQFRVRYSQVNIMLVVPQVDRATLDRVGVSIRNAEKQINLASMIVTPEDLQSSCDVFPVKFHDIQTQHRLLIGNDILSELAISDEHLRLRCEQELKNLMIRLGLVYLRQSENVTRLWQALTDSVLSFQRILPACLTVKTGMTPEADVDVLDMFAAEFSIEVSVVSQILELMDSAALPENSGELFGEFMQIVRTAANAVDQLEETALES
jgi:hypothetical protein